MLDILIENANVIAEEGVYGWIGLERGVVRCLGDRGQPRAKVMVDAEGCTVVPGFVDAHTHLMGLGLSIIGLDLSPARSREEALDMVRKAAAKGGPVVVGSGWDESAWGETEYLRREELDFTTLPVVLYRRDGHMAVLNTAALEKIGVVNKMCSGVLKEGDLDLLREMVKPDKRTAEKALRAALQKCASEGVTTVRDIADFETYTIYREMGRTPVDVRCCVYWSDYRGWMRQDEVFWGVKLFLDGSIGARTAAFSGWGTSGLLMSEKQLADRVKTFWEQGVPVAVHAIGDLATEAAVSVLSGSRGGLTNSVEHLELVTDETLDRMAGSKVTASCQPNFLQWSGEGGLYEKVLGRYWASHNNPYRSIRRKGVSLAFGSDCMPLGPVYGLGLACNPPHDVQRLEPMEALRCYTREGARLLGRPDLGVIRPGAVADLVLLSALPPERGARVLATLKRGKPVYGSLHFGKKAKQQ